MCQPVFIPPAEFGIELVNRNPVAGVLADFDGVPHQLYIFNGLIVEALLAGAGIDDRRDAKLFVPVFGAAEFQWMFSGHIFLWVVVNGGLLFCDVARGCISRPPQSGIVIYCAGF
jgi:hypothetical protein